MNDHRTRMLLENYEKSLTYIKIDIEDLAYHIEETIKDICKMKSEMNYEGAWLWNPDTLMGHAYRILNKIQKLSEIYEEDYTEWGN